MSVTIGLLLTLTMQAGVALANQKWNSENARAIRDIQRQHKEDAQKNQLRRDRKKFERSRELQKKMEIESQQDRIRSIRQDFLNSFKKMAHNATLASHYPLKVSPYIISKTVLPISDAELGSMRQEILCILTSSNSSAFNRDVLPYLDETLCQAIARYWNGSSLNQICYYQGMWDCKKDYCDEDIENIKTVIKSPTLTLTPFFSQDIDGQYHLLLKVHIWGTDSGNEDMIDVGIAYPSLPESYSAEDIHNLLNSFAPLALCVTGQLVDMFYWTINNTPPVLPHLVTNGAIAIPQKLEDKITATYAELYMALPLGRVSANILLSMKDKEIVQSNAMTDLFNFPERSIDFLKSCLVLTKESELSNQIIEHTVQSLYSARSGENYTPIELIDVRRLDYDDMALVTTLIELANKIGNTQSANHLVSLVSRKITTWK